MGIWIERKYDFTFLVGVYQREFNRIKFCVGPSIVLGSPNELWLHFGLGFGEEEEDWDEIINHTYLVTLPLALSEKRSECGWVRIDWFEVKVGKDGYMKNLEVHENGYLDAVATSDEKSMKFTILGKEIYSVKVKGSFKSDYGLKVVDELTLYYAGKRDIRKGDKIQGSVKFVTLPYNVCFLSALGECYWITKGEKEVSVLPVTTKNVTILS